MTWSANVGTALAQAVVTVTGTVFVIVATVTCDSTGG